MKKYKHLPRFEREAYIGTKHIMFDMRTYRSHKTFVKRNITETAIDLLRNYAEKYQCEVLCYIFMPDHVHLIVYGQTDESDCLKFHDIWKSETAIAINKIISVDSDKIFQKQSYDHILRSWEYEKRRLFNKVQYIVMNPVRAKLVDSWQDYPYLGSSVGNYDIRHPFWWDDLFPM